MRYRRNTVEFSRRASTYEQYTQWLYDPQLTHAMKAAIEGAGYDGLCLDVCGGTGRFAIDDCRDTGRSWIVVDSSESMLRCASEDRVPRCLAAAECLPFADDSVELVLVRSALEYVDVPRVFSEVKRVLSPEGRFVVVQKTSDRYEDHLGWLRRVKELRSPTKSEPWTSDELTGLLAGAGFRVLANRRVDTVSTYDPETWVSRAGTIPADRADQIAELVASAPRELQDDTGFEVVDGTLRAPASWQVMTASIAEPDPRLIPLVAAALAERRTPDGHRELLLQRRRSEPEYWRWWELPQGHVRHGESIEDAAVRELREETGLVGEVVEECLQAFGPVGGRRAFDSALLDAVDEGQSEFVAVGVKVRVVSGTFRRRPDQDFRWFRATELEELLASPESIFPLDVPLLARWIEQGGSSATPAVAAGRARS